MAVNYFYKLNAVESTEFTPSEQETIAELGIIVDNHWAVYEYISKSNPLTDA